MTRTVACAGLTALLATIYVSPTRAQSRSTVVLAGYGSATYEGTLSDDYPNDFSASVSPVLLYSMGGDVLFEAELEFGLSGELTTTTLEYAQIDYMGFDNIQIVAGKFLLPFGVFGERLHPSWVNKLPSSPILFGHAHGGVAEGALLPILSDAGLMLRWAQPFGTGWALDFSGWVSQGPRLVEEGAGDGHAHAVALPRPVMDEPGVPPGSGSAAQAELPAPAVGFGVAFADNNKNKMLGGRLGLVRGPSFEAYVSGFHAMYDAANFLDYVGAALSVEWRKGTFEIRAEGVLLQQEFEEDLGVYPTLDRSGFYVQASRRFGAWEPVVRFGRMNDAKVDGAVVGEAHSQLALGLDYWFGSSIPLKLAWEYHEEEDDRLMVQWAFGF
jgi:hypothetical protein